MFLDPSLFISYAQNSFVLNQETRRTVTAYVPLCVCIHCKNVRVISTLHGLAQLQK